VGGVLRSNILIIVHRCRLYGLIIRQPANGSP
jgi:hypothetical protein